MTKHSVFLFLQRCLILIASRGLFMSAQGVESLLATGHEGRIDLEWLPVATGKEHYVVERAEHPGGPFVALTTAHRSNVYSDFIGENERTFYYKVTDSKPGAKAQARAVVSAKTVSMTDEQLLDSVQLATFRYFWNYGHPESGLAREYSGYCRMCATGGTGFGLYALIVGAERGFVPRSEIASRVLKVLQFLGEKADRFHGAFPHWLDGESGKVLRFSPEDNGADLLETALLMQGVLGARQYFNQSDRVEVQIRLRCTQLWEAVEWDWFLKEPAGKVLYWHWSPEFEFKKNLKITGFNEGMIAYLLAIASPTHPIPADCYWKGWAGSPRYTHHKEYYGLKQSVGGVPMGGPLFMNQYSFVGFDPRNKSDGICNYFHNARDTTLIHRAYCIENTGKHTGYGASFWGLTSSFAPARYQANAPGKRDDGTVAPTAALSSMPFTPKESMECLKTFYHLYGQQLWGEYGFRDAINPDQKWVSDKWVAIDQGPIIAMIENARSGLCWRLFMANPEIDPMLRAIGWKASE